MPTHESETVPDPQDMARTYALQIGGVFCQPRDKNADVDDLDADAIDEEVFQILQRQDFVESCSRLDGHESRYRNRMAEEMIFLREPYHLRINLPEDCLHHDRFGGRGEPIRKFQVIMAGTIFGAYVEAEQVPGATWIAQEFATQLMIAVHEVDTDFKLTQATAIDSWRNIYLGCRDDRNHQIEGDRYQGVQKLDDSLILLYGGREALSPDVFAGALRRTYPALSEWMEMHSIFGELNEHFKEISERFDRLDQTIADLHQEPSWRLLTRSRHTTRASEDLRAINSLLVTFQNRGMHLESTRSMLRSKIDSSEIWSRMPEYFWMASQMNWDLPESLVPALNYFDKQVSDVRTFRTAVVASIIGAIVGAVLTAGVL